MQVDFFHVYPGISATALLISGGVYALVYAVLGWVFYKRYDCVRARFPPANVSSDDTLSPSQTVRCLFCCSNWGP